MTDERRRSRRFPEVTGRDAAILTHGRKSYDARVIDVSAEGFRLEVPSGAKIEVGDVLGLKTVSGKFAVRVMNAELLADGGLRIGCIRTDDRPASRDERMAGMPRVDREARVTRQQFIRGMIYLLIFLVIFTAVLTATLGLDGMRKLLQPALRSLGM